MNNKKKKHFIGIGGIGMSALADICLSMGDAVTGSDIRPNDLTRALEKKGAGVFRGHAAANVPQDAHTIVRSSCIRGDNPEMEEARRIGANIISRGELLREVMAASPFSIGVTGTHGKTTTSSLIAHIAECCGKDPTVIVGGEIDTLGGNSRAGRGGLLVAEVDESDGYFRCIAATCAVITNIEREHMENYGSMDDLIAAYREFAGRVPHGGSLVFNGEDSVLAELTRGILARLISFGLEGEFAFTGRRMSCDKGIDFDLIVRGEDSGRISTRLIGRHNVMNILAAAAACMEAGLDTEDIIAGVNSFRGVKRRFELIGKAGGVEVVEDYAHHPTEIRAVIGAAKKYSAGRVIAVFQPHRYSRTLDLVRDFKECFYGADVLFLTDIYSADEDIIPDIGAEDILRGIDRGRFESADLVKKEDIPRYVAGEVRENDLVLVLGAGDIREVSGSIVAEVREKYGV